MTAALVPIAAYSNGKARSTIRSLGARKSAAKTGTAQLGDTGNNKDAWMVGYAAAVHRGVGGHRQGHRAAELRRLEHLRQRSARADPGRPRWTGARRRRARGLPEPDAVGGQAGIPYEPPPVTYTAPTQTYYDTPGDDHAAQPTRYRPQMPTVDENGGVTLAPGVTVTVPVAETETGEVPVVMTAPARATTTWAATTVAPAVAQVVPVVAISPATTASSALPDRW